MRVLLAGGGSAGHTSPLIATADALRRKVPGVEITCLGTQRGPESWVIPAAGYPLELIPPVPLPRSLSLDLLRVPARLSAAVSAARAVVQRLQPDVVAGFGGYVSMPAYLAARRETVPLVIHEGNALPGVANRFGARVCTKLVATSFPDTKLAHAQFIGLPIRLAISTLDRADLRPLAREHFGLDQDRPTLLVTGGSQGARRINESMAATAHDFAAAGIQVLHVKGPKGTVSLPADLPSDGPPYVVVPFVDRMELAYAAADAVVGRAGANSVTEAAAIGLPAVFVPLPVGNGEQALNAASVVAAGGGVLVDDADFTPDWVRRTLPFLLADEPRLAQMSRAATGLIRRDADDRLSEMIVQAAQR
ncbi:MAG: undecaprenyldiphospho-muramoylpentapeptide beta-N-acetylglucosaminyltransferase [Propionibacteriales bacterium]|nr:undecaprenyldiphospho-muramoylpentapeptide beta-N-acetylglucosaminyltransferase [Propionibacteriales bacterium]